MTGLWNVAMRVASLQEDMARYELSLQYLPWQVEIDTSGLPSSLQVLPDGSAASSVYIRRGGNTSVDGGFVPSGVTAHGGPCGPLQFDRTGSRP
jgi:hypothetical protein